MTAFLLTGKKYGGIIFVEGGVMMKNSADPQDIVDYLIKIKRLIKDGKYDFVPRKKCLQSLASHGLTVKDAKDEILSLTARDYYKGPKEDYDVNRPGDVWEFKKNIDGTKFYIKIKIEKRDNDEEFVKCFGFHEDEFDE